jgi:hypothetical protein
MGKSGRRGRQAPVHLPKVGERIYLVMCVSTHFSRGSIYRDNQLWVVVKSMLSGTSRYIGINAYTYSR